MKPLSTIRAYAEVIILAIIAVLMMVDIDGAYASPVSEKYDSMAAAEDDIGSFTTYEESIGATAAHFVICTYELAGDKSHVWYENQELCLNTNSRGESGVVLSTNKKLNKSKDYSIHIQYNLINGQTLTRTYTAWASGDSSTYLILSNETDVAEFMTLYKRTSNVIVTYQADDRYAYMLVFKLEFGRFSM